MHDKNFFNFITLQGWGCGYRSLQTLCSWACNTCSQSKPTDSNIKPSVPSLKKIQSVLVELNDKPSSFIGSKDWIGSYEVFLVLDHLYGVSHYYY